MLTFLKLLYLPQHTLKSVESSLAGPHLEASTNGEYFFFDLTKSRTRHLDISVHNDTSKLGVWHGVRNPERNMVAKYEVNNVILWRFICKCFMKTVCFIAELKVKQKNFARKVAMFL